MEELDPEEQFLRDSRNGNLEGIQKLLMSKIKEEAKIDINCKGKSKSNHGWTPLHLACYFGHRDVVEALLKAGADVNLPNNVGDTPLHKAAFTGRKEVVMLLLQYDACASVINGMAQIPKDITQSAEIKSMLEAAERTEERKLEEQLLEAAREGAISTLTRLLNMKKPPNISCTDLLGNTPLHCTAYRGQKQCAVKLLQHKANPNIKNKIDQTVFDLANDAEMKQIITGNVMKGMTRHVKMFEGPLWKSSRFFGWRSYWVVLLDGVLSWYPKRSDADSNTHRQGCKPLTQAQSLIKAKDNCYFTVRCFDDTVHHFKVSQKNDPESTRKRAEACHQKLETEVLALLSMVKEDGLAEPVVQKLKEVCEASSETCSSLHQCLGLFSKQEGARSLKLEQELEKNKILSEALQTLATEHHELEQSVVKGSSPRSVLSEDEFHDALSDSDSEPALSSCEKAGHSYEDGEDFNSELYCSISSHLSGRMSREDRRGEEEDDDEVASVNGVRKRSKRMYVFSIQCVAAFAVSAVASQWERTGKPFNPLLGETYELVRDDLGFRLISEQVSHHPPVSAFHAEGLQKDFVFHGSIYPKLKFWGKSVEAEPKGIITLELPKHNEAYTWTNPTCCVHNIIVGQLWIEQYGSVEVINHRTGEKCCLSFKPCGLFGKELHKVEGYILDKSKKKVYNLYGKWTECMYIVDPATFETHRKNDKKASEDKKSSKQSSDSEETPQLDGDSLEVIPGSQLLWRIAPRPVNSAQMYNFTTFAMQLNELDKEIEVVIPKTDSRLRPDIQAMENGDIDLASEEKKRLEEKQRAARKNRSKSDDEWKMRNVTSGPRWFHQGPNPHNGSQDWLFSNGYWDRDYSQLPDIY
ncbi:oxysterol-binding protein-related protein 1-like [Sinocyclocheilus grahami]|uniref:oxysterol-binding protein-related protein 1-like n=1 Tax=Sinocyclocheilus grahami TaxID=75366 RepID=UPI0007AD339D|nr:PREDICTED: oxysterol-binding protein-related protein 1-like [Sinocyclocheilus grahami]